MAQRKKVKYVHEGRYVAEVEVALLEDDTVGPLISVLKMLSSLMTYGMLFAMVI